MLARHVDVIALAVAVLGLLASEARLDRHAPKVTLSGIRIHNVVMRANVCPLMRAKLTRATLLPRFE